VPSSPGLKCPGYSALVGTGFSYQAASRARQPATLARLLPRIRDVRSSGSAAIELCWVAVGRCDAYYEDELAAWDTAAGRVIVREAGGRVTDLGQGGVLAANPMLHGQLRSVVDPLTEPGRALSGRATDRRHRT
jgi:myo-inositol-1(or 4)-monophosphatase